MTSSMGERVILRLTFFDELCEYSRARLADTEEQHPPEKDGKNSISEG